jgi:hypothetical protein
MIAHRTETTLAEDGVITIRNVPFERGDAVEVIVLPIPALAVESRLYPLRGTTLKYDSPTEPVDAAGWEAAG